ncbi:MAG: hypothetical protein AB8B48_15365, partial [Pseudomonadales bacterium]
LPSIRQYRIRKPQHDRRNHERELFGRSRRIGDRRQSTPCLVHSSPGYRAAELVAEWPKAAFSSPDFEHLTQPSSDPKA